MLSIAIITKNRERILCDVLSHNLKVANRLGLRVQVHNNASTDMTSHSLQTMQGEYSNLDVINHIDDLGYDRNYLRAMKSSETEYTWVIGDASYIDQQALKIALDILNKSNGLVLSFNNFSRVKGKVVPPEISTREYLSGVGWHLTLIDTTIWPTKIFNRLDLDKYNGCNLIQLASHLEILKQGSGQHFWLPYSAMQNTDVRKHSYWYEHAIDIWCVRFLSMLKSVDDEQVGKILLHTIRQHNNKSGVFGIPSLLRIRAANGIGCKKFFGNLEVLRQTTDKKTLAILFLSCFIPRKTYSFLRKLKILFNRESKL